MHSKQIKGLPVVAADDGSSLGAVERAYLDPVARRVIGFAIGTGAHLFGRESSRIVDTGEVAAFGPDALTLPDATGAKGAETIARYGDLIDLDDLNGRPVYTEGGTLVGGVGGATIDDRTFALNEFEAAPGLFKHSTPIAADLLITIGPDVIVVRDAVSSPGPGSADSSPPVDGDV